MKRVIILGTDGRANSFNVSSNVWSEIYSEIVSQGYEFPENTKATLVRVGGVAASANFILQDNSVLPENATNYLIAITQEKMKGAVETNFSLGEINEMSHREVISTLKLIRMEAKEEGEIDLYDMIPNNYSSFNSSDAKNLLNEVWLFINQEEVNAEISSSEISDIFKRLDNLSVRVLKIEEELLIPSEEFLNTL